MMEDLLPKLVETIQGGERLEIFLHDNPDPDAIAAGLILSRIASHLGVKSRLFHGGKLGRAENRTMVSLLKVPLRSVERTRAKFRKSARFALLDTQPGVGNNSFPKGFRAHIVIDHHPKKMAYSAPVVDIRPEEGACTTMLLQYLDRLGVELDSTLATAAAYAITSETQDLEREATKADREAYLRVFPLVRLPLLGKIKHPTRSREYYRTIARAMNHVQVAKNSVICHIGSIHTAEIVAEVADFLSFMERNTWTLVTGFHGGRMVLSIRTRHPKARADKVMARVLKKMGKGGGHNMIAGGQAPCETLAAYEEHTPALTQRFLRALRRKVPESLHPLIEPHSKPGPAS